jgi:hypothetical protein
MSAIDDISEQLELLSINSKNVKLDQFYTKEHIAARCITVLKKTIDFDMFDKYLEPSAGKGAFFKMLPIEKRIGIDLEPKYDGIIKQDFMDYKFEDNIKYLVLGNPPFGKGCSKAVEFFNKSALFATTIAFIIPRTFKRISVQNQLSLNFELVYSEDLETKPCCFEPLMNAKCCFQIWKKSNIPRTKTTLKDSHAAFQFVPLGPKDEKNQPTPPSGADFTLRAYGSNCGEIKTENVSKLRPKSWHWIKANTEMISVKDSIERFQKLDYSISKDTVRQDSIGQKELILLYESIYQ